MAICLDYQSAYSFRRRTILSLRTQLFLVISLLLILSARVWIKVQCTSMGYELASANQEAIELDMRRQELALELSLLLRQDNLLKAAKQKLNLIPIAPSALKRIKVK